MLTTRGEATELAEGDMLVCYIKRQGPGIRSQVSEEQGVRKRTPARQPARRRRYTEMGDEGTESGGRGIIRLRSVEKQEQVADCSIRDSFGADSAAIMNARLPRSASKD